MPPAHSFTSPGYSLTANPEMGHGLEGLKESLEDFLGGVQAELSGQTASLQSSEYAAWHAVQVPDVPPPLAPPLAPPSAPQSRVAPEESSEDPGDGWCLETMRKHGVTPGKSWGSLPKHQEAEWAARKCDRFAGQTASWIERGAKKGGVQERLASGLKDPRLAVAEGGGQEDSGDWCRQAMWKFDVRPGTTWGKLSGAGQSKWRAMGCDDAVTAKANFIDVKQLAQCGELPGAQLPLIAVCCGTTTRKVTGPQLSKLALFRYLLPSMAHTLECGFRYAVVVGFDRGDPFYDSLAGQMQVEQWFTEASSPVEKGLARGHLGASP